MYLSFSPCEYFAKRVCILSQSRHQIAFWHSENSAVSGLSWLSWAYVLIHVVVCLQSCLHHSREVSLKTEIDGPGLCLKEGFLGVHGSELLSQGWGEWLIQYTYIAGYQFQTKASGPNVSRAHNYAKMNSPIWKVSLKYTLIWWLRTSLDIYCSLPGELEE